MSRFIAFGVRHPRMVCNTAGLTTLLGLAVLLSAMAYEAPLPFFGRLFGGTFVIGLGMAMRSIVPYGGIAD